MTRLNLGVFFGGGKVVFCGRGRRVVTVPQPRHLIKMTGSLKSNSATHRHLLNTHSLASKHKTVQTVLSVNLRKS